jgi:DNA end-binding protein Ku
MASTVWRGYISFGLISIPVRLFRAARPERISFRRMYREAQPEPELELEEPSKPVRLSAGASARNVEPAPVHATSNGTPEPPVLAPLRQVSIRPETNERVSETSIVKGYEYEKNRYVALEPEELKSVAPTTSAAMEIEEFVQLADIDPVYFETSYYVTPEEAGEKAYALLYKSMQTSGLVALAQFAMHSREHVVVLRPGKHGLLAHTMFFANEVRADDEYHADLSAVSDKELKLAETLIHSLAAPFEPEKYRDTYREKIQALIDRKIQGLPAPAAKAAPQKSAVIDIADALRKSLANLKKPAASAPRKARKAAAAD